MRKHATAGSRCSGRDPGYHGRRAGPLRTSAPRAPPGIGLAAQGWTGARSRRGEWQTRPAPDQDASQAWTARCLGPSLRLAPGLLGPMGTWELMARAIPGVGVVPPVMVVEVVVSLVLEVAVGADLHHSRQHRYRLDPPGRVSTRHPVNMRMDEARTSSARRKVVPFPLGNPVPKLNFPSKDGPFPRVLHPPFRLAATGPDPSGPMALPGSPFTWPVPEPGQGFGCRRLRARGRMG